MQVRLAGSFENRRSKHWLILGALLAQPGRQLSFNTLLDWVWPEDEERPKNVQQTFHTYARRIRLLLRKLDVGADLVGSNGTLQLVVDHLLIDFYRFRDLIGQARKIGETGETQRARDLAVRAMELWSGPPLVELQTARAASWRRNAVQNHWIPANILLVKLHLALGEADQAIARLDDVQEEYPDNVALAKQRIMALLRLDRRPDADDCYFALRRTLLAGAENEAADDLRRFHDDARRTILPQSARNFQRSEKDSIPTVLSLPHAVPDFIGRERLLARLDDAAIDRQGRLRATVVCLDGASGVGKTAVATYWARRRHEEHADGAIFVDLRGFSSNRMMSPEAAVDELLHILGFPVDRIDSLDGRATKLRELLAVRRTTVVLDNVRDSRHVLPLLRLLSDSLVLITTRQRLTRLEVNYGARTFTVRRLSPDHAVDLIAHRIGERAARDRNSVVRLAELCEGLPLALTLVAHHIAPRAGVPLDAFVDRFRDPTVLLALGDEGDGADSSLRKAFATSYRALREPERRMFRLLGLHPGHDISLSAMSALVGLPLEDCRKGLDALIAAHLVEQRGALDRCRFHDLFRVYAASLAAAEESAEVRRLAARRMLDYYLFSAHRADRRIFAHRTGIPMPEAPHDVVIRSFDDEGSAAEWALHERINLMSIVRFADESGFPEHSWMFPHVIGSIFKRYGFHADAREAMDRGIEGARRVSNAEAEGATLNDRGLLALETGEIDEARRLFHLATYLAQSTRSTRGVASSLCNMARLDVIDGNIQAGIEHYQNALQMANELGNTHMRATVTRKLGDVYRDRRQYETAITHYQSALTLHQSIGHRDGCVEAMTGLSTVYAMRDVRDDRSAAREYARQAIEAIHPFSDIDVEQHARAAFAEVLLGLGETDEAVTHALRAVELARRSHAVVPEALALDLYARSLRAAGRPVDAAREWQQCAAIHRDRGDATRLARVQNRLGELAASSGGVPATRDGSEDPTRPLRRS
jgi:tetratricopeptide (TPR) repeat protein